MPNGVYLGTRGTGQRRERGLNPSDSELESVPFRN
jgi:hypothetical protein